MNKLFSFSLIFVLLSTAIFVYADNDANKARATDFFIRGTVADKGEDYYRAIFYYQEALRSDSTSPFIYVALAQDYVLLSNDHEAEDLLTKALKLNPNHIPALELQALMMQHTGRPEQARSSLEKLVKLVPENKYYPRQLLSLSLSQGKFDQVDKLYLKIEEKEGLSELLIKQILAVYLNTGEHDRSIPYLQKLIAMDSTNAALVYSLGTVYLQKRDTIRALSYMEKANSMDPKESRYWIGKTAVFFDRGDYHKTIELSKEGLKQSGESAGLYSLMGASQNRLGQKKEAIESLEASVKLDSTMFPAIGTLALIYDELDSLNRVLELYEQAIRITDSAAVYLNNLAYTYAERDMKLDEAKVLSQQAVLKEPKNASYLDTMGWIEFRLGNHDEAIKWLKRALDAEPKSAPLLEHLGDVYLDDGSKSSALKYYRRALQLDPTNAVLQKKLAQ